MDNSAKYSKRPVVWSEGMFLRPQHFQQQHEYYKDQLARLDSKTYYYWGLYAIEINQDLLKQGKFGLLNISGIFPDGSYFELQTDNLPNPIDIPADYRNQLIYLGLSIQPAKRTRVKEITVADSNDSNQEPAAIQIAQLNGKFLLDTDERGDYTALAIIRCKERQANNQVILDNDYIPPCLNAFANVRLADFIVTVLTKLNERCQFIQASTGSKIQLKSHDDLRDLLMLQTIRRYQVLLNHFNLQKTIHPESLYLHLIQLLNEMDVLSLASDQIANLPGYQHENLQQTFESLTNAVEQVMDTKASSKAKNIGLVKDSETLWLTTEFDHLLLANHEFILIVEPKRASLAKVEQFIHRIKVAAIEHIETLIARSLTEVELELLEKLPRQIPYYPNSFYFRLHYSADYRKQLAKTKAIAIYTDAKLSDMQFYFWALPKE